MQVVDDWVFLLFICFVSLREINVITYVNAHARTFEGGMSNILGQTFCFPFGCGGNPTEGGCVLGFLFVALSGNAKIRRRKSNCGKPDLQRYGSNVISHN